MSKEEDRSPPTLHVTLSHYTTIETPPYELARVELPHRYQASLHKTHTHAACAELCDAALEHLHELGIHTSKEAQLEAIIFIIVLSLKQTLLQIDEDRVAYAKIACDNCLKGFGIHIDEHHAKLLINSRALYYATLDNSAQLSSQMCNLCQYSEKQGVFTSMNHNDIIFKTQSEHLRNNYFINLTQGWIKDIVKNKIAEKLARIILYIQKKPLNIATRPALNDIEYAPSLLDSVITTAKSGKARFQKLNNAFKDLPYLPHLIAVMLLLAWLDMPYGYYMFLRLCVAAYAAFCFMQHLRHESRHRELFLILSAGLFLLYQPIVKVPLDREIWQRVNLATVGAVYFLHRSKSSV